MRPIFAFLLPVIFLAGCGSNVKQTRVEALPRVVRVDWLGHNCFLFTSSIGLKLLTDPGATRAKPEGLRADIILISHENSLVNKTEIVVNSPQIFRSAAGVGSNRACGILIQGVPTYPNPQNPSILGMNIVYTWMMDGVKFCHLGSLPGPLLPVDTRAIGKVDVLFMPYGGETKLTDADRAKIVDVLQPKIVVPMGFRQGTGGVRGGVNRLGSRTFEVSKDTLPADTTVFLPAG